jgi:choline dehydrogenase-like flavoprotein
MKKINHDYLVIGSGAGGAVAFRELSNAGKDVLLVEEGIEWTSTDFNKPIAELTQKLYRCGGVTPFFGKPIIGFGEACALGGSTVVNGGLLWRTPEWILDEWQKDYGINGYTNKDLSPYFEEIESSLNVATEADLEGYDNDSYLIEQASKTLGWKVVPVPRATINCIRKNQCGAGCPSGAKQSVDKTYIEKGRVNGGRVLTGIRVSQLKIKGSSIESVHGVELETGHKITIKPKTVFLAAGAINSAILLRKSKLSKLAGNNLQFHVNLKVFARYPHTVNAEKGTIFTRQVQEFEKEGVLIMGTNYRAPYLATTLAHLNNRQVDEYFSTFDKSVIYTPMIRPFGKAKIYSNYGRGFVIHKLDQTRDLSLLRRALKITVELIFSSGAELAILPIEGSYPVKTLAEANNIISQATLDKFQLLSVHAMSSTPMGITNNSVCDTNGRVRGIDNLYVCDASILPSNIGESPQGTIMAFSHKITNQILNF